MPFANGYAVFARVARVATVLVANGMSTTCAGGMRALVTAAPRRALAGQPALA